MGEMEFDENYENQSDQDNIYEEEYYSERNEDALVDEIFGKGENEIIINAENGGTGDLLSSKYKSRDLPIISDENVVDSSDDSEFDKETSKGG